MATESEILEAARAIDYTPMCDGDPLGVAIAEYLGDRFCGSPQEIRAMLDGLLKAAASAAILAAEKVREAAKSEDAALRAAKAQMYIDAVRADMATRAGKLPADYGKEA